MMCIVSSTANNQKNQKIGLKKYPEKPEKWSKYGQKNQIF